MSSSGPSSKKKTQNNGEIGVQKTPKEIPKVIQLKVCVEQRIFRRDDAAGEKKKITGGFASNLNKSSARLTLNVFESLSFDLLMTIYMMDYCKPFICRNKYSK